jgi:hypothetical protein
VPPMRLGTALGRFWRLPMAARVLWGVAALIALNVVMRAVAVVS